MWIPPGEGRMKNFYIQEAAGPTVAEMEIEIVERKGRGHPDTLCDAVLERIAQSLSRAYLDRFGTLLHFNCDKGLLVAGRVARRFGGGEVLDPMRLVIGDRATSTWRGEAIDVAEIAIASAKGWFRENLPHVDPDRHLQYQVELKPGSEALASLFQRRGRLLPANDTSAAVGYAPLSETERLVLAAEQHLNAPSFKARFPETGEDVKVMGIRKGRRLDLTVAVPLIDRHVESEADYFRRKEEVHEALLADLKGQLKTIDEITVRLNALDDRGAGLEGIYLSVLGTSAEEADSGEVGRGNQVNGLISLHRPRGSEAAAGKNPVSHVGKIYNVLSHLLADRIYQQIGGLRGVEVWLCSRIGEPIDRPQIVSVQIHPKPGVTTGEVADPIRQVVGEALERMSALTEALIQGKYPVC
jgi:S-adenosylmethionine synthetase